MMVMALLTLESEVTLATLIAISQYSMSLRISLAMYLAQVRMFSRSPPSLSLM